MRRQHSPPLIPVLRSNPLQILHWVFRAFCAFCPILFTISAYGQATPPAQPGAAPTAATPEAAQSSPAESSAPPAAPAITPCTNAENLLRTARPETRGLSGLVSRTTDGVLAEEGTFWSNPDAVVNPPNSKLAWDMRSVHEVRALVLQGDNNDEYLVEGSTDGVEYKKIWIAPPTFVGMGLRTRHVVLQAPAQARYLRIIGRGGDGFYSVSEVQALCKVPAVFPPKLKLPPKKYGWDAIDNDVMVNIKGVAAVIAGLLLIAACFRRFYEARIRNPIVRWGLVGFFTLIALMFGAFALIVEGGSGPAGLVKWLQVHSSFWGCFYSGVLFLLIALALGLLALKRDGQRVFDTGLAIVGVFCFTAWWNLGHYHFDHYIHIWEHYHYIMGAKYPELRYSRLYQCTGVADSQDGLTSRVKARKMRRIESDNELGTSDEILKHPELCTDAFKDPQRWQAFRADIRFFRSRFSAERWDESQNDHGYNATPVWAIVARAIVERVDLTWDHIIDLGIIDSGFLIVMWLAVLWAFGWKGAAVAAIWWGCNFPARFYWNGGSFLRYDWQLWMIVGICLLRKRWHVSAGAALTYGTLLRVFPGFVVAALVLKALAAMVRERRVFLSREHMRFAAGCIAAMLVLIPLSGWATNGLDAWPQFAQNSKKHLATALTNNMGLKTVLGYDFATRAINMRNDKMEDPFREWKDAKKHFYHTRAPIYYILIALFCLILARAGDREEDDWVAACLGAGLIVIAAELTCYYYGFLLTYGLLWERRRLPGILSAALAAFTCFIYDALSWNDDHFAAMSLGCVVVVVAVTAHIAFGKRMAATSATGTSLTPEPRRAEKPADPLPPAVPEPQ